MKYERNKNDVSKNERVLIFFVIIAGSMVN